MPPLQLGQLSRRERQIMDVLFEKTACSALEIQKALPEPPSYSTVRALLARLSEKGVVKHRSEGAKYIYFPVMEEAKVKQSALGRLIKTFFKGSKVQAVNALLDFEGEPLTSREVEELERTIKRLKRQKEKNDADC